MAFLTVLLPCIEYYEALKPSNINIKENKASNVTFTSSKLVKGRFTKMYAAAFSALVEFIKSGKSVSYISILIVLFALVYFQNIIKFLF
jgi:hypothetical protein